MFQEMSSKGKISSQESSGQELLEILPGPQVSQDRTLVCQDQLVKSRARLFEFKFGSASH